MLTNLPKAFNNMTIRNEIYKDYLKLYQEEDSEWLRLKVDLAKCDLTKKQKNTKSVTFKAEQKPSETKKICMVQTRNMIKDIATNSPPTPHKR